MTKQTIWETVDRAPCISQGQTLQELKSIVDALIDKYGSDACYQIRYHDYWVCESIEKSRLETDVEYQGRIEREQRIRQQAEEQERKEFERLKVKYGS